jgi:ABC-type branched-subunit amino acid transport system substrate-binding protein
MRLAISAGAFAIVSALAASAEADDAATGRRIFGRGEGGTTGEVAATFARTRTPLSPAMRRCANCHGRDGAGGRESGVGVPPITWKTLVAPRDASPGRPGRPGYDEVALKRALAEGVDPAGNPLAAGMPRFEFAPPQVTALLDYLRILGTERDLDPGLGPDEIRIGVLLPLSGMHAAWGEALRAGIEGAFAAAGPIYGRRLRLVAADAGNDIAGSLRQIVTSDQVFALVATMLPADASVAADTEEMPVIAPLVASPIQPSANHFYLLASVEDQMRVLVDQLIDETPNVLRLAVIGPEGSVADAVVEQATRQRAIVTHRTTVEDLAAMTPPAVALDPDAILALPGTDLGRLAAQLADRRGSLLLAGPAQALAPGEARDERLRLVLPVSPPGARSREASAPLPPLAAAAAAVLIEGVKRMGARASRAGLIAALETLRGFATDDLPPLSFGRGQHTGSRASLVIRPDNLRGLMVVGGWRTPR